jgi:hypothetical protein
MSRRLDAKRVSVRLYPEVKPSLLERVLSTRLQAGTAPAGRVHAETGHDGVTAPVLRALESLHRRPLAVVPELLASVDPARPFDFP